MRKRGKWLKPRRIREDFAAIEVHNSEWWIWTRALQILVKVAREGEKVAYSSESKQATC